MWRSTSYTIKANDFNVMVKDSKCGGRRLILFRLNDFIVKVKDSKCGGQHYILLRLMALMLRSMAFGVEINILYS